MFLVSLQSHTDKKLIQTCSRVHDYLAIAIYAASHVANILLAILCIGVL